MRPAVGMAVLLACCLFWASAASHGAERITAPYQRDLYELGYSVFLANNNPADALKVAEQALAVLPADRNWLRKAAQAADWSEQPQKAFKYWYALAAHDPVAFTRADQLARGLQLKPYQKLLLEQRLAKSSEPALVYEYIALTEALGMPEQALLLLERPNLQMPMELVLAERARLYEQVGRPRKAVAAYADLAAMRPLTPSEALRAGAIWYGIGDAEQAWQVLWMAAGTADSADRGLLETVSDLGWGVGHAEQAVQVSERLVRAGYGRVEDYQRLIAQHAEREPARSFQAALAGWQRYRRPDFVMALLDSGIRLKRWQELYRFLQGLTAEERRSMAELTPFWQQAAQIAQQAGDLAGSLAYSHKALRGAPGNPDVVTAHLWLLLTLGRTAEAVQVAEAWVPKARSSAALRDAIAASFASAGEVQRALPLYRLGVIEHRWDPAWLASYADLLDQAMRPEAAYIARVMAMEAVRGQRAKQLTDTDRKELTRITAQLAALVRPGDALDRLMRGIARTEQDQTSRDLVTGWLIGSERHDLARLWFYRAYERGSVKPVWAELSLALEQNDQTELMRLLANVVERLPYRDAVEAARRIGQTPLAESLAFTRFQANGSDHLLDAQVRSLFGRERSEFSYSVALTDQGGVTAVEQTVAGRVRLSNRWTLLVDAFDLQPSAVASNVMSRYPGHLAGFRVGATRLHAHGAATMQAGLTSGVYSFLTGSIKADYRLLAQVNADLALESGMRADESQAMMLATMKDQLSGGVAWQLDPRTGLALRGFGAVFRDQDRRKLGDGGGGDLELTHRVVTAWPDFGVRLFGGYHTYRRSAMPEGRTRTLLPLELTTAVLSYPESYGQLGGGLFFGQDWKTAYTRDWKAFGAVDASWNSTSGAGFHYELGVVGPLFGLDTLLFSLSQDSGAFGNSDLATRVNLKYRYRF